MTGGKGYLHEGAEVAPEDLIRNCENKYCLKDQEWSVQPSMNFPRCNHSSCVVAKYLYVLGGVNLMTMEYDGDDDFLLQSMSAQIWKVARATKINLMTSLP